MEMPEPKIHFCVDDVAEKNAKTKEKVLDIFSDCVSNFLYYDRKECDEFSPEDMEKVFLEGIVTIEDLVEVLKEEI